MSLFKTLFSKRLLFILGKGGVGKSTVAAALALLAAQQGKKTLLAELDTEGSITSIFGIPGIGKAVKKEIYPGISALNIDGIAALEEYLTLILKPHPLRDFIFRSKIYNYFVSAAPGLKELMAVGKIWYEEQLIDEVTKNPVWDLIIVDTPATGHALQYIRMPRAAYDAFSTGLVRREAKRVLDLINNPDKTLINLVTTPEEMPINETIEIAQKIIKKTELPLGYTFINKIFTPLWEGESPFVNYSNDSIENGLLVSIRHWAEIRMARWEQNKHYMDKLESQLAGPFIKIPFLFSEDMTLSELLIITKGIEQQLVELNTAEANNSIAEIHSSPEGRDGSG
jgi:anion-transporting  ArsA/GET3 family ATPase